jgi:hypothetical protein
MALAPFEQSTRPQPPKAGGGHALKNTIYYSRVWPKADFISRNQKKLHAFIAGFGNWLYKISRIQMFAVSFSVALSDSHNTIC